MYIEVKLLSGFQEPLLYKVPATWDRTSLLKTFVKVPLRNQVMTGIVQRVYDTKPDTPFAIKEALEIEAFPHDQHYQKFISQLAVYYQINELYFFKRIKEFISQEETELHIPPPTSHQMHAITLTNAQQSVTTFMTNALDSATYTPTVLHGVTGSGKTEVYKKLIEHAIAQSKSCMLLLPEVSLAVRFAHILRAQLPETIRLFNFHSAASNKEKKQLWQHILENKPIVIIGVHLPILLPIPNLGLIIVDEEHDVGYQEKKHPKINSKEAALWRAQLHNIPILLGSATPSLSTMYNVHHRNWHFFQLHDRFAGTFPNVTTVNLADKKKRKSFWISTELQAAIGKQLEKKEQTIIFLNRRGYSFFVQCKSCSFIFSCSACSVSLTLHDNNQLACHYCDYKQHLPPCCTSCKADSSSLLKKGIGTQQLVSILQKQFPSARIARADMDATVNKKEWEKTIQSFINNEIDILVGTQTITKGYHFPNVTLVGVLWADLNLHFPMYNAAETTLQQLIQVAGRAGRDGKPSRVIIQTLKDHPIFSFLNEIDYLKFYQAELENRMMTNYPPIIRLAEIELKDSNEKRLEAEALRLMQELIAYNVHAKLDVMILGPALPPVHKVKNWHRRKIYMKSQHINALIKLFASIQHDAYHAQIFFTPNPLN